MPSAARKLPLYQSNDPPLYTKAELIDLRRTMLLYARFFPPGYERNQKRQIAQLLRRLFQNKRNGSANIPLMAPVQHKETLNRSVAHIFVA
jgi:hypothetical protein